MQDSRSSVNDVSRYVGWLIAGLVIFTLSCSSGMFISFCTAIGLAASIRNSQLSPIFAYVLEGIAMTLAGGTVSGIISAFLGNLLFQSELAAHRGGVTGSFQWLVLCRKTTQEQKCPPQPTDYISALVCDTGTLPRPHLSNSTVLTLISLGGVRILPQST